MTINEYYKKELISLRKDGLEFSKNNPGLASYLSKEGQDPDVERLLEGFSFLTGRLHQRIDQELLEVSHTLVELLAPNYTRPIPSFSIIKFDSVTNSVENKIVAKNTEVSSRMKPNAIECKFRTVYDTLVMPLEIEDVNYYNFNKQSSLELSVKMSSKGTLNDVIFENLRVYLGDVKFMSEDLYLFLLQYIDTIEITIQDKNNNNLENIYIDKNSIVPVGFSKNNSLMPEPANVFEGYTLIKEYFCFKDKFLFVDITNLDKISSIGEDILSQSRNFIIKINFSKSFLSADGINKNYFNLYCTPIVNIFETDSVPIRKTLDTTEFLVNTSEYDNKTSEVFSIENVRGWNQKTNSYEIYLPFESFKHTDENEYYSIRRKLSTDEERTNTYVRFSNSINQDINTKSVNNTISIKILSTNKNVPTNLLLGDISNFTSQTQSVSLPFQNITIPTFSYPSPMGGDFLWKVISNISLNYLSLTDINALKNILNTYDFLGAYDMRQKEKVSMMLQGLENISFKKVEMLHEGYPIRGIEITLIIEPSNFSCIGEIYLFSCVLNEFFTLYSNVNSFHKLIVEVKNKEIFQYTSRLGKKDII